MELTPIIEFRAASIAKSVPCSAAKYNDIGPDVMGRPARNPPILLPHTRDAKDTAIIKIGVTSIFTTARSVTFRNFCYRSGDQYTHGTVISTIVSVSGFNSDRE